jgi:hypothetical protein
MDHVDRRIIQELVEGRVGARHAEGIRADPAAFGAAAQDAADLDSDPSQLLDVDGADEPRADDGRADLGDTPHALPTNC